MKRNSIIYLIVTILLFPLIQENILLAKGKKKRKKKVPTKLQKNTKTLLLDTNPKKTQNDIVKNFVVGTQDFYKVVLFTQKSTTFYMPFKCADPIISDMFLLKAEATDAIKDDTLKIQKVDTPIGEIERVITPYATQFNVSYVGNDLNIDKATSSIDFTCEDEQVITMKIIVKGQVAPNENAIRVNFVLQDHGDPEKNKLAAQIQKQERKKWSQRLKKQEENAEKESMLLLANALKDKSFLNRNGYKESTQFVHTKMLNHLVVGEKGYVAFEIHNRSNKSVQIKKLEVIQTINAKQVPLKTLINFKPFTLTPGYKSELALSYYLNEDLINIIRKQGKRHADIYALVYHGEKGKFFKVKLRV